MSSAERKGGRVGRAARGTGALALLAAGLLLAACGGSGQLAGGGIGGTGISSGPITAFGSIVVGGVEYELGPDTQVYVNGELVAGQQELALGMVVTVEGRKGSDTNAKGYVPGQALRVDYASDLLGPVEAVDPQAGTLTVLGVQVQVPATAVLEPAGTTLAALQGEWVEVSGLEDAQGVVHATRIELKGQPAADQVLRGTVSALAADGSFQVRGIPVDAPALATVPVLRNGLPVEVYGSYDSGTGTFVASRIELDEADVKLRAEERLASGDGEAELEGLVSSLTGSVGQAGCRLAVAGVAVDCAGARLKDEHGFGLADGARVEVEGTLTTDAAGEPLVSARKVEVKAPAAGAAGGAGGAGGGGAQATFVDWDDLPIEQVDPKERTVRVSRQGQGYVVRLDAGTVFEDERSGVTEPLNLGTAFGGGDAALRQGDLVEIKGYLQDGTVTAVRLEAKDPAGP